MISFNLSIYEADSKFYNGECESLIFPSTDGDMGIMAGHSDMVAAVVTGELSYKCPGEENWNYVAVSEGIIKVEKGDVLVLTESAEAVEDIDMARIQKAMDEAKEAIRQKKSRIEYEEAGLRLSRANNRLRIRNKHM